jgi:hypothetical protein
VIGFVQPGLGLGFGVDREIAFGLGAGAVGVVSAYSPPPYLSHGHGGWGPEARPWWEIDKIRKRAFRDDEEILEIIATIVLSGRLN